MCDDTEVDIGLEIGQLNGFKVFTGPSFSPIVKTYFPGNFCISVMSNLDKVWHRWPVRRQRSMVNLSVRAFRSKAYRGSKVFRYPKTTLTSQIRLYLGREGFNSKTPFRNRVTSG